MSETATLTKNRWAAFAAWAHEVRLTRKLAYLLVVAAVVAGVATYGLLTGSSTDGLTADSENLRALLMLDMVILLLLAMLVMRRLVAMWLERRSGRAGSGLHMRMVMMFSLVAVTPAILVAVFAALFLNFGINFWFSNSVRSTIEESHAVATAYLHEHQQGIRAEAFAMANDLNRDAAVLTSNLTVFAQVLNNQSAVRGLAEAAVIDGNGEVLARSDLSLSLALDRVPQRILKMAERGEIIVIIGDDDDRVRAVVKLNRFVDAYLLVGRFVDAKVLNYIQNTKDMVAGYKRLDESSDTIHITFVVIFAVVTFLLLLAAIWVGMTLATQLVSPIGRLISAAERVGEGDLAARVSEPDSADELSVLARTFNRMTGQLRDQQEGLILVNRQLDERRRFTETVLSGVSAGVIGLDADGRINLPNRSASELLGIDLANHQGDHLSVVVGELDALLEQARKQPWRVAQGEVSRETSENRQTLIVNVAAEHLDGQVIGFVVTFDDVSDLLSAQRKAAWADVARRIAHEIKNPLTPIQLSAERLKRKYLKQIDSDSEIFEACTDTIVRQVADIGRMVDEFSDFARMPQPVMADENLARLAEEAVFLETNRNPAIAFKQDLPADEVIVSCDRRQISQALTNLLKNAAEGIEGRREGADGGCIETSLSIDNKRVYLRIEDNGCGLPADDLHRLTEPYVTTRDKGTGLGLAIVKKIVEDHGAELLLENREGGGARVTLVFNVANGAAEQ